MVRAWWFELGVWVGGWVRLAFLVGCRVKGLVGIVELNTGKGVAVSGWSIVIYAGLGGRGWRFLLHRELMNLLEEQG